MSKLLSSEFIRLFKNKVFYILCGASAVFGAFLPIAQYLTRNENGDDYTTYADTGIFAILFFGGFAAAILISLFTGTEYSDGTIRNKLVCGYSRSSLYISKVIVNYTALLLVYASFYVFFLSIGSILLKNFSMELKDILFGILLGCLNLLVFAVIFTSISLCKNNKAGVAVFSLVLCLILLVVSSYVDSRLRQPEILESQVYILNGEMYETPEEPNPSYISGTKREIFTFIYDFNPMGQSMQMSGVSTESLFKNDFAYYSLILTIAGILITIPAFKKKNIN